MAMFEGARKLAGGFAEVDAKTVAARLQDVVLVDVREPPEWTDPLGHVAEARLVPLSGFPAAAAGIPKDKPVVCVCKGGVRSAKAAAMLVQAGVTEVYSLTGGMTAWNAAGLVVKR